MMTPDELAGQLNARLDGPHDDRHTAAASHLAAEAIRYLNYATGSHATAGLAYPATVYEVTADLSSAAHRMVQLLTQLGDWLAAQDTAGMLGTDDGRPVAEVVAVARLDLAEAAGYATSLSAQLSALQNAISGLNGRGPNRRAGGAR